MIHFLIFSTWIGSGEDEWTLQHELDEGGDGEYYEWDKSDNHT